VQDLQEAEATVTFEEMEKLRTLIVRKAVLHQKCINGDYGKDHEHKTGHALLHDENMVKMEIETLLRPAVILSLLDTANEKVDLQRRLDAAYAEVEDLKRTRDHCVSVLADRIRELEAERDALKKEAT
jgi:predicted esterase YcpF (UPF0227 family)